MGGTPVRFNPSLSPFRFNPSLSPFFFSHDKKPAHAALRMDSSSPFNIHNRFRRRSKGK